MAGEAINPSVLLKELDSFKNQSVVFIFNGSVKPIACTLPFLYTITEKNTTQYFENTGLGGVIDENDPLNSFMVTMNKEYQFYRVIQALKFEYGLKAEYYKNSSGIWIDMIALRHDGPINYKNDYANSGQSVYEDTFQYNTYRLLADSKLHFDGNSTSIIDNQYIVSKSKIPEVTTYVVNEDLDRLHIGSVYKIGKSDGTIELKEFDKIKFEKAGYHTYDNTLLNNPNYVLFTETLASAADETVAQGSFEENNNHKFDDLKLTFTNREGNPYQNLDNLLCFVNGVLVDYVRSTTITNAIYLPDVIQFSDLQNVGTKTGFTPSAYVKEIIIGNDNRKALDFELEEKNYQRAMKFDVQIYKWDNVKISHRIGPINTLNVLKTEEESSNTFWLPTKLVFSDIVNKDKTILVCNNEIIPKDEWDVENTNSNIVRLKNVDAEFNILYAEMKAKLLEYMEQIIGHSYNAIPNLNDYIGTATSLEEIETGYNLYEAEMTEYIRKTKDGEKGFYDIPSPLSALAVVKNEFMNRSYFLITVDQLEDRSETISIIESKNELILDKPYIDRVRNKNWMPDDIIIINGLNYRFENEYEDVFRVPMTYWLPKIHKVFYGASAYKLKIVKEKIK